VVLWVRWPTQFMASCQRRFGDIFTVNLPVDGPIVNLAHPDLIKTVFTGDSDVLHAGEGNAILEPVLGRHSVLLLDGREHLRQRRLMLPPFHGERMQGYAGIMETVTEDVVANWPHNRVFALRPSMQAITLDVIIRAVFGVDVSDEVTALRDLITDMLAVANSPLMLLPWLRHELRGHSPWGRFVQRNARVNTAIYALIAERRRDPRLAERSDILALLLQARDEDGNPLTDVELRDELMTLLLAGHETTATSLAWGFDLLLHHPDALRRLEDELERGETAWLDAVIRETMRMRPVILAVARRLTAPFEIGGYHLPAGTVVAPNIWLTQHRDDVYPDPHAFRPERFLEQAPEPYSWLPFGGGIRRCLGASFATFEMRTVIPAVLRQVRLRPASAELERVKREAVTFVPARGTRVIATAR
jgi:cytochrome P450